MVQEFVFNCSVRVIDLASGRVVSEIDKPRTSSMQFSPQNTVLATWEPYMGEHQLWFSVITLRFLLRGMVFKNSLYCSSDKRSTCRYAKFTSVEYQDRRIDKRFHPKETTGMVR